MTTWEYCVDQEEDHRRFLARAQVLGADGWEMIEVVTAHGFWIGFFKRPVIRE